MSNPKRKKKVVTTSKAKRKKSKSSKKSKGSDSTEFQLLFTKKNYTYVLIGLACMILGMILMLGGGQESPDTWNAEEIYSFRRITLAPFLILVGLVLQVFAIFKK